MTKHIANMVEIWNHQEPEIEVLSIDFNPKVAVTKRPQWGYDVHGSVTVKIPHGIASCSITTYPSFNKRESKRVDVADVDFRKGQRGRWEKIYPGNGTIVLPVRRSYETGLFSCHTPKWKATDESGETRWPSLIRLSHPRLRFERKDAPNVSFVLDEALDTLVNLVAGTLTLNDGTLRKWDDGSVVTQDCSTCLWCMYIPESQEGNIFVTRPDRSIIDKKDDGRDRDYAHICLQKRDFALKEAYDVWNEYMFRERQNVLAQIGWKKVERIDPTSGQRVLEIVLDENKMPIPVMDYAWVGGDTGKVFFNGKALTWQYLLKEAGKLEAMTCPHYVFNGPRRKPNPSIPGMWARGSIKRRLNVFTRLRQADMHEDTWSEGLPGDGHGNAIFTHDIAIELGGYLLAYKFSNASWEGGIKNLRTKRKAQTETERVSYYDSLDRDEETLCNEALNFLATMIDEERQKGTDELLLLDNTVEAIKEIPSVKVKTKLSGYLAALVGWNHVVVARDLGLSEAKVARLYAEACNILK